MNKGIELWNEAKKVIPGGNQLLSKRAEMFLPDQWPAYYKRAKGVKVWDLDDNELIDMSIMGIGTCVLGYANDGLQKVVKQAVEDGSMATLNCYEEVELAKKLIELHPWAEMVRFARTGGEVNAVAMRIARAYSRKDKIAFCGYHGWHDWYLASNISSSDNLNGQLLPGLMPDGVPQALGGTALPFYYGDIEGLKRIFAENIGEIGAIVMEVMKYREINLDFISQVREIADEAGAVLIFDEISSGFRVNAGGSHMLYDIKPDIVTLAKALGGGYPIAAVVGKREIMEAAQSTFISSTYWTERIGFVAGLEVIRQFEENNVAGHLKDIDQYIREGLKRLFKDKKLDWEIAGMLAAPILVINEDKALLVKSIITQEMLKRGFLASNIIYVSFAHTREVVDKYLKAMDEVLDIVILGLQENNLNEVLMGPVCHGGFKRLN